MMMPPRSALRLVAGTLRLLTWLNLLLLLLFAAILAASYLAEPTIARAVTDERPPERVESLLTALRLSMLIGILVVPLAHLLLTRLRAIVATVAAGDPFVPENADRLTAIAWALLGIQICDLAFGAVSLAMAGGEDGFGWSPSLTGFLAVALLFVLASVFRHGTRMRDELAGTI